jgi:hypothetical protein
VRGFQCTCRETVVLTFFRAMLHRLDLSGSLLVVQLGVHETEVMMLNVESQTGCMQQTY